MLYIIRLNVSFVKFREIKTKLTVKALKNEPFSILN